MLIGNKTQCDICNSKAARKARLKKEKEQQTQDGGAGAAAAFGGEPTEGAEATDGAAATETTGSSSSKQPEDGIARNRFPSVIIPCKMVVDSMFTCCS